jgi:hypothetical protein
VRLPVYEAMTDGVEQVSLAQADTAVKEERVVAAGGILRHGPSSGVGELVGAADDKALEDIVRIERAERRCRRRSGVILDRDQHADFGAPEPRDGSIDGSAIALLECAEKPLIRREQLQTVVSFRAHTQRTKPGGKLFRLQLATEPIL